MALNLQKLKSQVSNLKSKGEDDRVAIGRFVKQITQLEADLAKFGGHTADCAVTEWRDKHDFTQPVTAYLDMPECDCGWAEIER